MDKRNIEIHYWDESGSVTVPLEEDETLAMALGKKGFDYEDQLWVEGDLRCTLRYVDVYTQEETGRRIIDAADMGCFMTCSGREYLECLHKLLRTVTTIRALEISAAEPHSAAAEEVWP